MSRDQINADQIRAAQGGDSDAMWQIVMGLDATLRGIVRSVAPTASREDAEDYLQEARVVLIQRIKDFDSDASSAALMTYVYQAARRAVTEAHISNSCPVSIPASAAIVVRHLLWRHGGNVEKVWEELEGQKSATHKISREMFVSLLEALADVTSLDAPAGGDDADGSGLTLSDVLPDHSAYAPDSFERVDLARWLMTQIPPRQAYALRAFYGVGMTKQEETETCDDLAVKPTALRKLRSRGLDSALTVATAHGLSA
ncbi:sigma factor [Streptomyces sp. MH60]|uniref:sigma factor n=1 Tax=Streptomyces sp. MH60 TaxID=1940758 RepID=UPI000CEE427E|nr:sigma factor [Streptomyces sp. MH60]PPS86465.1 RNA polymerase sigma factor SigA [Streptomyces sp. MH60]